MSYHHSRHPQRLCVALTGLILLVSFISGPLSANDNTDAKSAAVAAMQTWLQEVDQSHYAQSWTDASAPFRKAITSDKWTAALNSVRTPLGKCMDRKLGSSLYQTQVPSANGPQKGEFVIAQFDSSFDNLKYAIETVCFAKAPDGTWKAAGYYIKPKA